MKLLHSKFSSSIWDPSFLSTLILPLKILIFQAPKFGDDQFCVFWQGLEMCLSKSLSVSFVFVTTSILDFSSKVPVLWPQTSFMMEQKAYTYSFLSGIYINELALLVCPSTGNGEMYPVVVFSSGKILSAINTHKCGTVFISEANDWCDTVRAIQKQHTMTRKSFSFPGSTHKWKLMGVILLDTYPLTVLSFVPKSIQRDI